VNTTICQCGAEVEFLEGRSVKCKLCGTPQGSWVRHPDKRIPHVIGSYHPAICVRQGRFGLEVVSTRSLKKGELVERIPTLWSNSTSFGVSLALSVNFAHPTLKGESVPLSSFIFKAPLLSQCILKDKGYATETPHEQWGGWCIPLGLGAVYNHSKDLSNIRWETEFIGYRLFLVFKATKDVEEGHELRHDYGYQPKTSKIPPLKPIGQLK
jgi:hypothetical protein